MKEIVYDKDFDTSHFSDEGNYYKIMVSKILKKDIFIDNKVFEEKNDIINFQFKEIYNVDYNLINKQNIVPDFLVHKIQSEKFFELLKKRNYMMVCKYNIPKNKKFITILGEIKSSYKDGHRKSSQRKDYIKFVELVNNLNTEEFMIFMYIYDQKFILFKNELKNFSDNSEAQLPLIYSYIPKLYYENCNVVYNYLINQLKYIKKLNDLSNKSIFENRKLLEKLEIECKWLKRTNYSLKAIIIILSIFLISYIIGDNLYNLYYKK